MSWVMFAVEDFNEMGQYFVTLFTGSGNGLADDGFLYNIKSYGLIILIAMVLSTPVYRILKEKIAVCRLKNVIYVLGSVVFVLLFLVTVSFLVRNTYNPFLYFRF